MPDLENVRTQERFRAAIEEETEVLRRIGWTTDQINRWLAGARFSARLYRESIENKRQEAA